MRHKRKAITIGGLGAFPTTNYVAPPSYQKLKCVSRGGYERKTHSWITGPKCFWCDLTRKEAETKWGQALYHRRLRDSVKHAFRGSGVRIDRSADGSS